MTWRKARIELPEIDEDHEIIDRHYHVEPEAVMGMRRRHLYEEMGQYPTAMLGYRYAGRGRKTPFKNWKQNRTTQYDPDGATSAIGSR